jgi:hypothetical protein
MARSDSGRNLFLPWDVPVKHLGWGWIRCFQMRTDQLGGFDPVVKRYWHIRGYKKFDTIFDETIPVRCLTEGQLKALLKCLAAKGGLSLEEIIGAYVKTETKRAHRILEVHGFYPEYFCGDDPSFVTTIVDEEGNRVEYKRPHGSTRIADRTGGP